MARLGDTYIYGNLYLQSNELHDVVLGSDLDMGGYSILDLLDIEANADIDIANQTLTADNEHDVNFFGDTVAQSGAYNNKVNIYGGSSESRSLSLYQDQGGSAYVESTYNALILIATGAGSTGVAVTTSAADALYPTVDSNTDLGTTGLRWATIYADDLTLTNGFTTLTVTDHIHASNSEDVGLGGETGALIVGMGAGGNTQHIAIDGNEIMSKSDATTAGTLYLQASGGNLTFGSSGSTVYRVQYGASINYDGNYVLDTSTTGSTDNSPDFFWRGNYYSAGDYLVEAAMTLYAGADPYLAIAVDNSATLGTLTGVIRIYDNHISPEVAGGTDLGHVNLEWNDAYISGTIYLYSDQNEWVKSDGSGVIVGAGGYDSLVILNGWVRPSTANTHGLGGPSNEWADVYVATDGKVYLADDQYEWIYGDGGAIYFGVGNADELWLGTGNLAPAVSAGLDLGHASYLWDDLYISDAILWDDGEEYIYGSGTSLVIGTGGAVRWHLTHNIVPNVAGTQHVGSTAKELGNIYLSGYVYMAADQQEWVYSNGTNLAFGAGGATRCRVATTGFEPFNADTQNLGGSANEWANIYLGTGYLYFYTDQGESISSNGSALLFGITAGNKMNLNATTLRPNSDGLLGLGISTIYWGGSFIDHVTLQSGAIGVGGITFFGGATNYMALYQSTGDQLVWRADVEDTDVTFRWGSTSGYGYDWVYAGAGSGDANYLQLFSHNATGTDFRVMQVHHTTEVVEWGVDMNPDTDSTYDLGTDAVRWAWVYADNVDTNDIRLSNGMIWREDGRDVYLMNDEGRELFRITDNGNVVAYGNFEISDEVIMHDV